ncbi:MAG: 30S ribosomal protein S6 [Acidimicrobiales bacterium]
MRPYEVVIIFDAGLEEEVIGTVLERVAETIRSRGGNPGRTERWGRRRFAYEVDHRQEGYYVLQEMTAEPAGVAELDRVLFLADEVVRHKIIRLPESVAGRSRPVVPPVEEAPVVAEAAVQSERS